MTKTKQRNKQVVQPNNQPASTARQRQFIHQLLLQHGVTDADGKEQVIAAATQGRTNTSLELTYAEADTLIKNLLGQGKDARSDVMRKKIIHWAHLLGWQLENGKIDMAHIDQWCNSYGQYHKPLMEHNYEELVNLVTQFRNMFLSELRRASA